MDASGARHLGTSVELLMSEGVRCDRCGALLKFVGERVIGPEHVHHEYECSGCLHQSSACSEEGFKLIQHHGH